MVSIFTGAGVGFERNSGSVLGSSTMGRGGEQLMLNAATGNLIIGQRDEFIVGLGLDAAAGRTYNSLGQVTGDTADENGDKWRQGYDRRIINHQAGVSVQRVSGDGSVITYNWDALKNAFVSKDGSGAFDTLALDAGTNTWTWTDGDSLIKESYAANGAYWRLTSQADTDDNTVTFSYGTDGNLSQVTTQDGSFISYIWGANNQLLSLSVTSGGVTESRTSYTYDASGRLATVTVDMSPVDNSVADGNVYVTTYTYAGASTRVARITQSDGSRIDIGYDSAFRVTSLIETAASGVTRSTSVTYGNGFTDVADPAGNVVRLSYDASGQLLSTAYIDNRLPDTSSSGLNGWGTDIDPSLIVSSLVAGTVSGKTSLTSTVNATAAGQQISIGTDGSNWVPVTAGETLEVQVGVQTTGVVTTASLMVHFLDAAGNYLSGQTIGGLSGTVSFNSRISGSITVPAGATKVRFELYGGTSGAGSGTLRLIDPVLGKLVVTSSIAYNGDGDITSVQDALGNVTTYADFVNGMAQTITDRLGMVTTRTFNAQNRMLTETRAASDTTQSERPVTTRYVYDSKNHLRWAISAEGRVTEYRYLTSGLNNYIVDYPEHSFNLAGWADGTAPTLSDMTSWAAAITDKSSLQYTLNYYDSRGNLTKSSLIGSDAAGVATAAQSGRTDVLYIYDMHGRLLSRNAVGRNAEQFVYDGFDRIVSSVDVNGATTSYVFNDAATTTTVTFANGLRQVSTYNKAGELISFAELAITPVAINGNFTAEAAGTAQYGYDKQGRLRWQSDATGRKSYFVYDQLGRKIADVSSQGDVVQYRYDVNGRLIAKVSFNSRLASVTALDDLGVDPTLASVTPTSSATDLWEWHVYDNEGRLMQSIAGDGSTTVFSYDRSGQLVKTTSYANLLSASQLTGFKTTPPSILKLPTTSTKDVVVRNFYDKDGRLVGALDGEGYLSKITYDQAGAKVRETKFANPTGGNRATDSFDTLLASIAQDVTKDRSVNYSYDGRGQLRYVVDSLGYVTQTDYDGAGQATIVSQYAIAISATSDFTYDNIASLVAAGNLPASVGTRVSYTVYDTAGRAAYVINPEGAVTQNSYSPAGQLVKSVTYATVRATSSLPTRADMATWVAGNSDAAKDRVSRFYYDGVGTLRYTVDGEGFVSQQDVDAEGRVIATSRWSNAVVALDSWTTNDVTSRLATNGGAKVTTATTYDALGRLETVVDGENIVTRNEYQANGLVWKVTAAYGTNDAAVTTYNYDNAGRVIRVRDAENYVTASVYDGLGNVTSVTRYANKASGTATIGVLPTVAANASADETTSFTYDRRGLTLTRTDALNGLTTYTYNAFGQAVLVTDPLTNSTYNYYDRRGLLVSVRDAENYVTETTYTAFGQVDTVTRRYNKATGTASINTLPTVTANAAKDASTHFDYDRRGLVINVVDAETKAESYGLNAFGDRVTVTNKLGGVVTNVYDRRGLLTAETLPMSAYRADGTVEATSVTNKFEYDGRGNRTKMIEASDLAEQRTTVYAYDKTNRLISKSLDAVSALSSVDFKTFTTVTPTESYTYDARGNLKQVTSMTGGRTVSFYDKLGRKTAEVGPLGTMTRWTYDANGNMLSARVYGDVVSVPAATDTTPPNPISATNYRETTFTFDKLNRLLTSDVANVLVGSWNGSGVAPAAVTVTTRQDYDANGNVTTSQDANGGLVYSYYDKLGRKTQQLDAEGYLTSWSYDSEGNVLTERRYATQWTGAVSTLAVPAVGTSTDDRITNFTYDRNGHRLTEARVGVEAWSVNGSSGALTLLSSTQTVTYTYNALGQVWTKREATGDTVSYTYDVTGRLIAESRAAYNDQAGVSVTPTVEYLYNAVNDLARTRQGGLTAAAGDRITTYAYGANGRLASMTDPLGYVHSYSYDAAGNLVRDSYTRTKSNGVSVSEGVLYTRDLLGRVTSQAIGTFNGTSWIKGDSQNTEFNAFGETSKRGVNGLWQEQFVYDVAGRLEKTNSGDGVWRFFVYDANGNKTLTIESEGNDLSGMTVAQAVAAARPGGVAAGSAFVDGINVGITTYDKRNMALSTILPQRELAAGAVRQTITTSQTYNAFGEVASQTDAKLNTSNFTYNTMGRLTKKELPLVNWTNEAGVVAQARPTELYYYDRSGRMIANRDANGNLTSRVLLAGSGYGGSEAQTVTEFHADGGIARTYYDQFGDARTVRNELGIDETRVYDAMGRLVQQNHRGGLVDYYAYDLMGQRTRHWNSFLGVSNVETTDYDLQGRVVSQVAFGGDSVTTSYAWDGTIATGLGTTGGFVQTDYYVNGKSMTVKSDIFGHDVYKSDLGSHITTWTYDRAGRQTGRTIAGETLANDWLNSGLIADTYVGYGAPGDASWSRRGTAFTYDANGNLLTQRQYDKGFDSGYQWVQDPYDPYGGGYEEYYENSWDNVLQSSTAAYDVLNRMISWSEAGGTALLAASKTVEYDLNGNIRRDRAVTPQLNSTGGLLANVTVDSYFAYDSMNRVTISDGKLVNGVITYGNPMGTVYLTYDAAGQRISADRVAQVQGRVANPNAEYDAELRRWIIPQYTYTTYESHTVEKFTYNANGTLSTVRTGQSTFTDNGDGTGTATPPSYFALKGNYYYDTMGRVTRQIDWIGDGTNAGFDRTVTYNAKGQIYTDRTITKHLVSGTTYDTYDDTATNLYGTGTTYALGAVTQVTHKSYKNGSDDNFKDAGSWSTYAWYDGAVQSQLRYRSNASDSGTEGNTYYYYDAEGHLTSARVQDGRPRTITYTNDTAGMTIRRQEYDNNYSQGDPLAFAYRFGGREISRSSNVADPEAQTYNASISDRTAVMPSSSTYTFLANGAPDGNLFYEGINSYTQGAAGGQYTVRAGDTLQGIALSTWGDASMWYKIAEANGISGDTMLIEGQTLTLPAGVVRTHNNASTFTPYDPSQAIGDTAPTTPKPPKKKKCGGLGMILLAVVAIAVTTLVTAGIGAIATGASFSSSLSAVLGGSLAGLTGTAAGATALGTGGAIFAAAAGAAVGSIVSQGIGVATGLQDKFSWKGVALAALGAGLTQGLGPDGIFGKGGMFGAKVDGTLVSGAFGKVSSDVLRAGLNGVATSLVTQGIGVITKLQPKFDWAGVAAAGMSAAASAAVAGTKGFDNLTKGQSKFLTGSASLFADAATYSVASGTDFGDNILNGLPDLITSTIGGYVEDALDAAEVRKQEEISKRAAESEKRAQNLWPTSLSLDGFGGTTLGGQYFQYAAFNPDDPFADLRHRFSPEGIIEAIVDGLAAKRDQLAANIDNLSDAALDKSVRGLAYAFTTAAINQPFITPTAERLLTQWRDGTSPYNSPDKAEFFGWNSEGSRDLMLGFSGDYVRSINVLGVSQLAKAGNGRIVDGTSIKISSIPDFGAGDGFYGMRDGISVGDTIGTFTHGVTVTARGDYLYFRGDNTMSLGSFAADNKLKHNRIRNTSRGAFSNTYQVFEWRVPIPKQYKII